MGQENLWKMKQSYREKDKLDRLFLSENNEEIVTLLPFPLVPTLCVGTHQAGYVTTRSIVTRGWVDLERANVLQ